MIIYANIIYFGYHKMDVTYCVLGNVPLNMHIYSGEGRTIITVTSYGCDGVSNHQPHDCLLSRLFRRGSKKTSKLRVTDLWAGNSPVNGEFPAQMVSNAENVSIWWRHHVLVCDSNTVTNIYKNRTRCNKYQMQHNWYFPIVFVTLNVTLHWENQ